ncbi:hypothetical protein U9M48_004669 [Paspalum notatum var. saurae]|uniref:Uncharacterized protein n=1 Tax=Paspalum notatum var. saurae TaxID=547442 RepID=A0AAQ3PP58_PASNO
MEALTACSSNAALAQESGAPVLTTVFFRLDQSPKGARERLPGLLRLRHVPHVLHPRHGPPGRRSGVDDGGPRGRCRQPPTQGRERWRARGAPLLPPPRPRPARRHRQASQGRLALSLSAASHPKLPLLLLLGPPLGTRSAAAGAGTRSAAAGAGAGRRWPRGGGHGRRGAGMAE